MGLFRYLHQWRREQSARLNRKNLNMDATIGVSLCQANWQKVTAILGIQIGNRSGLRDRIVIGDHCNLNVSIDCNRKGNRGDCSAQCKDW